MGFPLTIKDNSITSFIFKIKNLDRIKSITYRISCKLPIFKVICIINASRQLKKLRVKCVFSGIVVSPKHGYVNERRSHPEQSVNPLSLYG